MGVSFKQLNREITVESQQFSTGLLALCCSARVFIYFFLEGFTTMDSNYRPFRHLSAISLRSKFAFIDESPCKRLL